MPETPTTIIRPNDNQRKAQLDAKLTEYQARLETAKERCPNPQIRELASDYWDAYYKSKILDTLLKTGEANSEAIFDDTIKDHTKAVPRIFQNAFNVINGYVADGGKSIKGGTGLPETD